MQATEPKMWTVEIWVALDENGHHVVATEPDEALENLKSNSAVNLNKTVCRVVKLNITMSEPRHRDDVDDETDKPVDVTILDDAGRIVPIDE
jgi:hypothetical protein